MFREHIAVGIDDIAGIGSLRPQFADHRSIVAIGDETDVLAVGFVSHHQPIFCCQRTGIILARQVAQREAQVVELLFGGGE